MLPLNLGIRAHDLAFSDLNSLIDQLNLYELHHIQFAPTKCFPDVFENKVPSKGLANYYGQTLRNHHIKISILGCYINLSASDLNKRQNELDKFKYYSELVTDFDAAIIGTETGSVGNGYTEANFTESAYVTVRNSVSLMIDKAEKLGVTIGIEPGQNHPIHTSALAKRLLKEIDSPNLKIILDFANLVNSDNYMDLDRLIEDAIEDLVDDIAAIHLKDFMIDNHQLKIVPVGQGLMDYRPILKYIKLNKPMMYTSLESTKAPDITPAIESLQEIYDQI
ncbi:sugar phosphate isomerase/epimerase family protein [Lapidilactobacillus mulanensis]|uniref:Sugar phosphate isomerase/epimerase family protein n=1 Tax=Lapidilactobacillus mulanensis TaxID=2485999 RepID=A0ABW4DR19_9LACO|nr:sugar phosphate isomerase/epimerase family protein [Lapidilactobacillus mulanensis]